MDRHEAASLLGVDADADPDAVRHAWRIWARMAHPDAGGDPEHFARLDHARRTLLGTRPAADAAHQHRPGARRPEAHPSQPREPLTAVLTRPVHGRALLLTAVGVAMLAAIPGLLPIPLALGALPVAIAGSAWAVWATREMLCARADHGHRISALSLAWLVMAAAQVPISVLAGASLVPVLPLLAVPLAAAVAAINPGAGLWRPVGG